MTQIHISSPLDDLLYFGLEVENRLETPIKVLSASVKMKDVAKVEPVHLDDQIELLGNECFNFLYKLIFYQKLEANRKSQLLEKESCFVELKYQTSGAINHIIISQWVCHFDSNGILKMISTNEQEPKKPAVSSSNEEGLGFQVSVEEKVYLNKSFSLCVIVTNSTNKNKDLIFQTSSSQLLESQNYDIIGNKKDLSISMDPIRYLELYEHEQLKKNPNSFLFLENFVKLPSLTPQQSYRMLLHAIPIKGPGTVQKMNQLTFKDENDEIIELNDFFEVFVHPPNEDCEK